MTSTRTVIEELQWGIKELREEVEAIKKALARQRISAIPDSESATDATSLPE